MDTFYLTQEDLLHPKGRDHEDHLPRYQGQLDVDLNQGVMDGYSFQADYLGFTTVSKPPTNLGIIQPPVKELYVKCLKQGGEVNIKKVILRIIPGGLIFTFLDSSQRGEVFFDINSMIYFEGLQFQLVRGGKEKKPHALFVPLDEGKMTSKDEKSAFSLDKNHQFLTQLQHPPLLTCVLRRPKGIKALDCHLFIFNSKKDVVHMMDMLAGLRAGDGKLPDIGDYRPPETNFNRGQKNDVIRTEYGEYAVYRGNQMELKDDFFRPRDENGAFDERKDGRYRDDRRPDERYDRRDDRSEGRDDRSSQGEKKTYDWDYDSSPIDNAWRSVQKDYSKDDRSKILDPQDFRKPEPDRGDHYVAHSRDRSGDSNEGRFGGRHLGDPDRARYDDRPYKMSPHMNPKVAPPVAHKPASPRPMSPTSPKYPVGGYGALPPRDDPRGFDPRFGGPPPDRGGPVYSASNLEGRRPDRNSKGDEDMPPKPVAKVPPHLVAGIKVLPTNFNPQGVKLKPRSPNTDKSVDKNFEKPFHQENTDEVEYDNVLQKLDKMIADESDDTPHGRPTQQDREMYDQNIRKNWVNEEPRRSPRQERGPYGRYEGPDDRRYIEQYDYNKRSDPRLDYRDDPRGDPRYDPRGDPRYDPRADPRYDPRADPRYDPRGDPRNDPKSNPNRYSMPLYDERASESPNRWSGSNKSHSSYEMAGRSAGMPQGVTPENPDHNNRKKDAEIANMFGGHNRDNYGGYRPINAGTNFEQSLGYYP